MSALGALSDVTKSISRFALQADLRLTRLRTTVDAVNANAAATPVEKMVADSVGLWLDGLEFWLSFVPEKSIAGSPVLLITAPANVVGPKNGDVVVKDPGAQAVLAISSIRRIGGAEVLAVGNPPTLNADRTLLSLSVVVAPLAVQGLYEGIIYAQPQVPVAVVLVALT